MMWDVGCADGREYWRGIDSLCGGTVGADERS